MTPVRAGFRRIAIVRAGCCSLWLAGLLWFATPLAADAWSGQSDAIVVLTGGSLRLQAGLGLLREGKGRKLFVSGVSPEVGLDELLRAAGNGPNEVTAWASCCVTLGHEADNTLGNAQETARWMRSQSFHSLRLVTAWYHMPRSLLEFERAMPEIKIVPHPVFPDSVKPQYWWAWRRTVALVANEYAKYLAAFVRPWVRSPPEEEMARFDEVTRTELRR